MQSVLAKLSLCRTRALGGKSYQCDDCGEVTEVHHSCGDRHCPQCSGCKRYDFAERAEQLILEGVTYYQVVFTLPRVISELALTNREAIADLLFDAAAASLRKTIRSQQEYDPAAMMVLHTWNQQLMPHWHVHALVPGGGPSLSGDQWKSAQAPPEAHNSNDHYLVDAISLREAFRKAALSRLRKLYSQGKLKLYGKFEYLSDEHCWKALCDDLAEVDWVSFIQPPPTKTSTAEQVVRYLTRYLTGGPISDSRIVTADTSHVTFLAREGVRVGGQREQVPVTIPTMEFMRRWCLHIQSEQLTKTRYFGGWCCHKRAEYQATCRRVLGIDQSETVVEKAESEEVQSYESPSTQSEQSEEPELQCAACGSYKLRFTGETPKPSWSDLLTHEDDRCPAWYAETEYQEFCAYLEREYGISYSDWSLEMREESTMSEPPQTEPPQVAPTRQLYLPGLLPHTGYMWDHTKANNDKAASTNVASAIEQL